MYALFESLLTKPSALQPPVLSAFASKGAAASHSLATSTLFLAAR